MCVYGEFISAPQDPSDLLAVNLFGRVWSVRQEIRNINDASDLNQILSRFVLSCTMISPIKSDSSSPPASERRTQFPGHFTIVGAPCTARFAKGCSAKFTAWHTVNKINSVFFSTPPVALPKEHLSFKRETLGWLLFSIIAIWRGKSERSIGDQCHLQTHTNK